MTSGAQHRLFPPAAALPFPCGAEVPATVSADSELCNCFAIVIQCPKVKKKITVTIINTDDPTPILQKSSKKFWRTMSGGTKAALPGGTKADLQI